MVATAVGLLAAVGFGLGTYTAGIVAALLFQLAAIIDCCDGEVARLTFTESAFGAWRPQGRIALNHQALDADPVARAMAERRVGAAVVLDPEQQPVQRHA